MPWDLVELNDGRHIPFIGFGTWKIPQETCAEMVEQALETDFIHIDTAQAYRNEAQVGDALVNMEVDRSKLWITTKHSRDEGLQSIEGSLDDSLGFMKIKNVDLYLLHSPNVGGPDLPAAWDMMEKMQKVGKAKSIGVSNYEIKHLEIILKSGNVKPAVNQIEFHPECLDTQLPIHEFGMERGIRTEAYSLLTPLTQNPTGLVAKTVNSIAEKRGITNDQVLMAWAKDKGAIILTTSSKKSRLEGYQKAADIDLSDEEIESIDASGFKEIRRRRARNVLRGVAVGALTVAALLKLGMYFL